VNTDLLRFKNNSNIVLFDYETCSLNLGLSKNKPWQLAFLVIQNGKIVEEVDYRLKWDNLEVSPDAAKITGFNKKKHDSLAVDPKIALDHFEKYLYDKDFLVVGHNILGFDVYIHNIHRNLLDLPTDYSYINKCLDTVCLARAVKKEIPFKNGSLLSWQYKLNGFRERGLKVSLQQCCKDYSIDFDPKLLHDALYDIKKNHEVFNKLIWQIEI
jgi:DNA polymerase III epsilon subunit-like protein